MQDMLIQFNDIVDNEEERVPNVPNSELQRVFAHMIIQNLKLAKGKKMKFIKILK